MTARVPLKDGLAAAAGTLFVVVAAAACCAGWHAWPPTAGDVPAGAVAQLRQQLPEGGWIWAHPGWRTDLVDALAPLPCVALDDPPSNTPLLPNALLLLTRPDEPGSRRLSQRLQRRRSATRLAPMGSWQVWRLDEPWRGRSPRRMSRKPARFKVRRIAASGAAAKCPWEPGRRRHQCPGASWNNVRSTQQRADGEERACLWVHPVRGASMELTWNPVQSFTSAHLFAGFSDHAARTPRGASARITASWGDAPAGILEVPNRRGWRTLDLSERPKGTTPRPPLVLDISLGPGSPGARHLCLDVELEP